MKAKMSDLVFEPKKKNLNFRVGETLFDLIEKESKSQLKTKSDWMFRLVLNELQRKGRI